jgi:S1-C subfamily serine protease
MKPTRRTESGLIELGDIIVNVGGMEINTEGDLFRALETYKPGDVVNVKVNRLEPAQNGTSLITKEIVLKIQLKASQDDLSRGIPLFNNNWAPPEE